MTGELGGGVPIEKDIIPSQREVFPNYFEHLFKDGIKIVKMLNHVGTHASTLYTVPQNHEFYLLSGWITGYSSGGAGHVRLETSENSEVSILKTEINANGSNSSFVTTPYPLKYNENMSFNMTTFGANIVGDCCIFGILIKKTIL